MVLIVSIVEYTPTIISPACGAFFGDCGCKVLGSGVQAEI